MRVARIFKGALTSLLTFVWEGLNPITSRLSTLLSLSRNSLERAMNLSIFHCYVAVLVCFPLNKLCWSSHLSMSILSPILFSMEKDDRKSTTPLALVYASPVSTNLLSV